MTLSTDEKQKIMDFRQAGTDHKASPESPDDADKIPLQEINHISLWMPNWIGDAVLVLPSLQVLRKKFPSSRITAIVHTPTDELLSHHPDLDSVIRIPLNSDDSFFHHIQFARGLKKYGFDLGVAFPNSLRSAVMMFLSGAKYRIGYNTDGRTLLLTHPVKVNSRLIKSQYRVDYFYNLLSSMELNPPDSGFTALNQDDAMPSVQDFLRSIGVKKNDFTVSIHPGTSKPERSWHPDRFGLLCQKLVKEYEAKIILVGNADEIGLLEQIEKFCPPKTAFINPRMNLREISSLIKACSLFIGNDSGMMHLAAMVGTPLVGIFGPGSGDTTGPHLEPEKKEIVTKNYPCSPCRQRFFKECKPSMHNKPFCLEDISIKDVTDAVQRLIKKF